MRYVQVKRLKLPIVYITATSHMHTALSQVGTVLDTNNLHFSAGAAWQYTDRQRGSAGIVCGSVQCRRCLQMNAEAYILN